MELVFILAADYANVTNDDKLNVIGVFGVIYSYQYPARHNSMQLVIQVRPDVEEEGQVKDLTVKLLEPDGGELFGISRPVQVPPPVDGRPAPMNLLVQLNGIELPHPGRYEFAVFVDSERKGELGIDVVQVPTPIM